MHFDKINILWPQLKQWTHVYCSMSFALAEVIFTQCIWYHWPHVSHRIHGVRLDSLFRVQVAGGHFSLSGAFLLSGAYSM